MTWIGGVGTYLPRYGTAKARIAGADEDTITMGVEAGRAALAAAGSATAPVRRVVLVTRDPALLEGGSGAVLLAGLGLDPDVACTEVLGGAPTALEALLDASPATLVIAADLGPAGAAAALVTGAPDSSATRINRSLPVRVRDAVGTVRDYEDDRLGRERGVKLSLDRLGLETKPVQVAGLAPKQAATLCEGTPPPLPTTGASSTLFALAAAAEGLAGTVLAVEQATMSAAALDTTAPVQRVEPEPRPVPSLKRTPGPEIPISLPAYERAFESKLRWEAGKCTACGTLAFPPRYRCLECGAEQSSELTPLPRTGSVYTCAAIHVPVPGLATPYALAIVDLDGVDVRSLVQVTGGGGSVAIGDRGELVFRRVAIRTGVPDYGYAFLPQGEPA